jgi:hypothetical protein
MPAVVNSVVGDIRTPLNGICGQGPAVNRAAFPLAEDAFLNPLMCFRRLEFTPDVPGAAFVTRVVDDDTGGEVKVR